MSDETEVGGEVVDAHAGGWNPDARSEESRSYRTALSSPKKKRKKKGTEPLPYLDKIQPRLDRDGDLASGPDLMKRAGKRMAGMKRDKKKQAERKGHWRKLPVGQKGKDESGTPSYGRTWVGAAKALVKNYGRTSLALAPAAVAKQVSGVPEGILEGAIESKLLGKSVRGSIREGLKTGMGRMVGGSAGSIMSSPVFFSGIKDLESDKKRVKARGTAKVLLASQIFSAVKGAAEYGTREGGVKAAKSGAFAKSMVNIPISLLFAHGIARSGKKKKDKDKLLTGALWGGALAGGSGLAETAIRQYKKVPKKQLYRLMRAKGLARLAAGTAGGAVTAALYNKAIRPMLAKKKEASEQGRQAKIWGTAGAVASAAGASGGARGRLIQGAIGGAAGAIAGAVSSTPGKKKKKKKGVITDTEGQVKVSYIAREVMKRLTKVADGEIKPIGVKKLGPSPTATPKISTSPTPTTGDPGKPILSPSKPATAVVTPKKPKSSVSGNMSGLLSKRRKNLTSSATRTQAKGTRVNNLGFAPAGTAVAGHFGGA